jgi:hypothetical protein
MFEVRKAGRTLPLRFFERLVQRFQDAADLMRWTAHGPCLGARLRLIGRGTCAEQQRENNNESLFHKNLLSLLP